MKKKIIFSIVLIVAMAMTTVFGALAANETTYDAAAIKKKYLESSYASEKEKLTIEGAVHASSVFVDPELYWKTVRNFIAKYM